MKPDSATVTYLSSGEERKKCLFKVERTKPEASYRKVADNTRS